MRLFSAIFQIVKLPLVIAKDLVTALPDTSSGKGAFSDTREQCEEIDSELSR